MNFDSLDGSVFGIGLVFQKQGPVFRVLPFSERQDNFRNWYPICNDIEINNHDL